MRDKLVEPVADGRVLLDVDAADAEGSEEAIERLAAREALDELTEAANSSDEVLLGSRVVDEVVEVGSLVDVAYGVEGTVYPLVGEVEDGRNGLVVVFVALCTITNLAYSQREISLRRL